MSSQRIHSDAVIMMGKPVIAGTRITVELILDKLAAGENENDLPFRGGIHHGEEICDCFSVLSRGSIRIRRP